MIDGRAVERTFDGVCSGTVGLQACRKVEHQVHRAEHVFIPCDIAGKGMFPTEVTVVITAVDGQQVTLFVDESLLFGNPSKVKATRLSAEGGVSVCLLPTEDPATGSRWVRVRSDDLQAA